MHSNYFERCFRIPFRRLVSHGRWERKNPISRLKVICAQGSNQDEEVQMGQQVFDELKAKGEIIESSPLYDTLRPIADAITRAAQPQYNHPFKFYLVHETQPNAFATPGGNVYVVDSLLYFVKNTEELSGTLCHEVSHTIHHDTVRLMEEQEKIVERTIGIAILLGPTRPKCWRSSWSESCIPSTTREMRNPEPTSPVQTFALPPDTTRGGWCGSSRISRMPTRLRYHNCCRTILAMRIASKRWRSISAKIQGFLESSTLIQSRRHRFRFRRMLRRFFCTENQFNRAATN